MPPEFEWVKKTPSQSSSKGLEKALGGLRSSRTNIKEGPTLPGNQHKNKNGKRWAVMANRQKTKKFGDQLGEGRTAHGLMESGNVI